MNKLIIDSREHSVLTEQVEKKAGSMNIPFNKEWIEFGDYTFNDVCFEAKSSFDFLQSVQNKRLWTQLDNMDRAFNTNVVIVHGSFDKAFRKFVSHAKTKVDARTLRMLTWKKFYGAIGRIILDTDCSIIWVKDEKVAAEVICTVCKMQPHKREIYTPRIVKRISTTDLRVDVLTTIKGISLGKAKLMLDKFGSIMEIGEASVEELCELEGVGKTLAERVINTLNQETKMEI
jgi:ERCC4-type nuclease